MRMLLLPVNLWEWDLAGWHCYGILHVSPSQGLKSEGKESVINVSLLGDLARARYGLDEVVWVYELPLLLLPTIHPLV